MNYVTFSIKYKGSNERGLFLLRREDHKENMRDKMFEALKWSEEYDMRTIRMHDDFYISDNDSFVAELNYTSEALYSGGEKDDR